MSKPSTFHQLSPTWQITVKELREECKLYRLRLRQARAEVAALREQLALQEASNRAK
ncbi:hypothetical protein [Gordonia terrae]